MQAKAQQNKTDKNVCWKPGSECIQFFFVFHQTLQTEGFESQKNLTNLDVSTVDTILGPWRPPTRAPAGGGRTSPGGGGGCDISATSPQTHVAAGRQESRRAGFRPLLPLRTASE